MRQGREKWSVGSVLSLLLAFKVHLVSAEFCQSETAAWRCACGCCDEYNYCCVSCGSYWYAWLLMTLLFLVCLCACLGCGSYGYRRYRQPLPTSFNVTPAPRYGAAPIRGFKPSTTHPSNYQPHTMPTSTATGYQDYRPPNAEVGYHGYPPTQPSPSEMPPPYNPSQAPPPYSTR